MTIIAASALQGAIYEALSTDNEVLATLGGPRIYDAVPQKADMPYIAFGAIRSREPVDDTQEHTITLEIWSRGGGHREAHAIAGAVIARLHEGALILVDHTLVNLHLDFVDTRRDADPELYRATLRFRAVTEPAA